MKYWKLLNLAAATFNECGVPEPENDAKLLLQYVTGWDAAHLLLNEQEDADDWLMAEYEKLMEKRAMRVPLQQIIGSTEFMGLPFSVNADVLCPRQDTETLVEETLNDIKSIFSKMDPQSAGEVSLNILDLCTGSGCIGISLVKLLSDYLNEKNFPEDIVRIQADLSDISDKALEVAKRNVLMNKLPSDDIDFYQGDLFETVPADREYDVIVCNPPYIRSSVISTLMPEVKDHEPVIALDGGEDGLDIYKRIISEASDHLSQYGHIYFEIGYDQGQDVPELLKNAGFKNVEVIKDLSGNDRVVKAVRV